MQWLFLKGVQVVIETGSRCERREILLIRTCRGFKAVRINFEPINDQEE